MQVHVRYHAPPTIGRFLDSNAPVRVVMGPLGSGKSSGCNMEFLRRAMEQAPSPDGIRRSRFAAVRNTYPQLRDTTQKTFENWIPPAIGRWHREEYAFRIKFKDVETEVLFRALDTPDDVGKLLSLELTGCYFNELREISKDIFDGMQGRVGRYPAITDDFAGATWSGIWADTNPWHHGHWADELFAAPPEGFELYVQPGGRSPDAENLRYLKPGYYQQLCLGKSAEWIRIYVDGQVAPSDVGSVFGAQMMALQGRGSILAFEHPTYPIHVSYDLGISDAMALWFWLVTPKGIDVVDHYSNSGKSLSHYFDVLDERSKERGYRYVTHWLPHDARARSLQTGRSTVEQFADKFGSDKVAITPELGVDDGLEAARWLLEQPGTRFHSRCEGMDGRQPEHRGIKALREYRYKWNEELKVFSKKPLHNWASNSADGFRYIACAVKFAELVAQPDPLTPAPPPARPIDSFTMDEAWDTLAITTGRERI
jgi:hypothetical protein